MGAPEQTLEGLAVSPGVAIGRAVCLESRDVEVFRLPIPAQELAAELDRLEAALTAARGDVDDMRRKAGDDLGAKLAGIFDAHRLLLEDPSFVGKIRERIEGEKVNAEWAVHKTTEELATLFAQLENERMRERQQDLLDVSRHLLRSLGTISHHELTEIEGSIIVAHDLTPSDAIRLGRKNVAGLALETGGRTSHTAIIARSLHLPLVTGLGGVRELVTDEDPMIVDGSSGRVLLHPTGDSLESYRELKVRLRGEEDRQTALRALRAETSDGHRVQLLANIDLPEEIDEAVLHSADGVGLYRSEFLYIERSPQLPDEDAHVEIYDRLLEAMHPRPVIVRTFDLGGRKLARDVLHTQEANPVLGLRGIRLTLARPEIFEIQVRALLRSALNGHLRVMLPMISSVEEVRQFKQLVTRAAGQLRSAGVPHKGSLDVGVMIEVPAAAWVAAELAREVSFFSIGTNDLIQYSLAVDRNNEHVSHLYRPLHPGILRMVRSVVEAAREQGVDVSLCGEAAADPRVAPLLIGLGVHRLSVFPGAIPLIKKEIRSHPLPRLQELAARSLRLSTAQEIEDLIDEYLERPFDGPGGLEAAG